MTDQPKKKGRLVYDLDPELWRWAKSQAALSGMKIGEFLNSVLRGARSYAEKSLRAYPDVLPGDPAPPSEPFPHTGRLDHDPPVSDSTLNEFVDILLDSPKYKPAENIPGNPLPNRELAAPTVTDEELKGELDEAIKNICAPVLICGKQLSATVGHICRLPKHEGKCPKEKN